MIWTWIGIGVGLPLLLCVFVYIRGRGLPQNYEAENKWRFPCPADQIWNAILDYRDLPLAGSMCKQVEELPGLGHLPRWREVLSGSSQIVQVEVADRPRRLVIRAQDEKLPMELVFTLNFDLREGATRILARRVLKIGGSGFRVAFIRLMCHRYKVHEKGQRQYLLALARKLGVESEFAA